MFRPAARPAFRSAQIIFASARTGSRFISTEPPHLKSRSWKSSATRWAIAIAGIYYYNTSPVFAEQPRHNLLNPNLEPLDDARDTSALDVLASRRPRQQQKDASVLESAIETTSSENASTSAILDVDPSNGEPGSGSPAELEEEAESQGAFNPETGEINWDCPCLGGMAHGPCGPEFREAFSCFVYSTEEPKGMDCIEKFQGMRDCFQKYPEVYKEELEDDEELDAAVENERQELAKEIAERQAAQKNQVSEHRLLEEPVPPSKPASSKKSKAESKAKNDSKDKTSNHSENKQHPPTEQEGVAEKQSSSIVKHPSAPSVDNAALPESDLIPKAAHDARETAES